MIQRLHRPRRTSVRRVAVATLLVGGLSFAGAALFSSSAGAATPAYNLNGSWALSIHNCQNVTKRHAVTVTDFSQSTGDFEVNYVSRQSRWQSPYRDRRAVGHVTGGDREPVVLQQQHVFLHARE
jgi:cytochrome c oxidase assembly factor CtaG